MENYYENLLKKVAKSDLRVGDKVETEDVYETLEDGTNIKVQKGMTYEYLTEENLLFIIREGVKYKKLN